MSLRFGLLGLSVALFVGGAWAQGTAKYTVTDLGPSNGQSLAYDINSAGTIVGAYKMDRPLSGTATGTLFLVYRACRWASNGARTDVGALGGFFGEARGVNAAGRVVGFSYSSDIDEPNLHAFRTTANQPVAPATDDLGLLAGFSRSYGLAVNTNGDSVGYTVSLDPDTGDPIHKALLWTASGTRTTLNTLGQNPIMEAYGLNAGGTIVGRTITPAGNSRACKWSNTNVVTDMSGGIDSWAVAINTAGAAVGSYLLNEIWTAFRTGNNQNVAANSSINIDPANGNAPVFEGPSWAYDINTAGDTVGTADTDGNGAFRAFYFKTPGPPVDLNTQIPSGSGWVLWEARGINDAGLIVGWGSFTTGGRTYAPRAFLLTPAP